MMTYTRDLERALKSALDETEYLRNIIGWYNQKNIEWQDKYDAETNTLKARIAELEAKWKVYCTADGDYPAIGLMTIFEDYAETYIGGFDDGYWFDQNKGQLEDTVGEVYWKPLISLELQYAQQALKEVTK